MKKICFAFALIAGIFMTSCTTDITLELNKDGSVSAEFKGAAGEGFAKLIKAATGAKDGQVIFYTNNIEYELSKSGLSDVKAVSKTGVDLKVSMKDKSKKSVFFNSDLIRIENNKLKLKLSPSTLKSYYDESDEQIKMYLDMLLSPVFMDEEISESEYLDFVGSIYGKEVSKELESSLVNIVIKNPDGSSKKHIISMSQLLTLSETILLE